MATTDPFGVPQSPNAGPVSGRLTGLLSQDNPFMQQARTAGLKTANRRGLLNSSIAVGAAQDAAIKSALPIASQEAQLAAEGRDKATSAAAAFEQTYADQFKTIAANHQLPAKARNEYLKHIAAVRDSNMNLVEQFYGIDLDWATPELSDSMPPPSPTPPPPPNYDDDDDDGDDGD